MSTNKVTFAFHKCNYVKIQNLHGKSSNSCCRRRNPPNKTNNNRPPTDTANADDPQAKTAAEFKSGEVAQLLAKGGEAWKNVKELPGVESVVVPEPEPQIENPDNPETATEDITLSNVKIWSFEKTIFVENAVNEIVIIDLTGRVVKNVAPDSDRMEIQLNKGGIYIVKTGLSTKKVSVK